MRDGTHTQRGIEPHDLSDTIRIIERTMDPVYGRTFIHIHHERG